MFTETSTRTGGGPSKRHGGRPPPWTEDELDTLRRMAAQGADARGIGMAIRRSTEAIRNKAWVEGITLEASQWNEFNTTLLRKMAAAGATPAVVAATLDLSRNAVLGRAYRLDIAWKAPKLPPAKRRGWPPQRLAAASPAPSMRRPDPAPVLEGRSKKKHHAPPGATLAASSRRDREDEIDAKVATQRLAELSDGRAPLVVPEQPAPVPAPAPSAAPWHAPPASPVSDPIPLRNQ